MLYIFTLKKRGYNNLIVIDIANIKGVAYNLDFTNSRVVHIKPYDTDDLGAAFDFDPSLTEKRMAMGYLDTKKAFGELSGNIFHFLPFVFRSFVQRYGADEVYELEQLGHKLGLSLCEIYSEESFMNALKAAYEKEKAELLAKEEEKTARTEKPERAPKADKSETAESPLLSIIPFPIITPKNDTEEKDKAEENTRFNLRSYFSQKKSAFEGYEKAVEVLEGFTGI